MRSVLLVLSLMLASLAHAEEKDRLLNKPWLFLGIDAGYSHVSTDVPGEENKSGFGANLKVLLSYYWEKIEADAGLGLQYKSVSGERPTGKSYTLETRSAFVEVGARYRINPRISIGPFLAADFGTDLSQRPSEDPILINEPQKNFIFLAGLQGFYETSAADLPLRLGLRYTTAFGIPNGRSIFELQAVAQIGFSLEGAPAPAPQPATDTREGKFIDIPLLKVFFALDSSKLDGKAKRALLRLGDFLMKNQSRYVAVGVLGHTDQTGSAEYNQNLSERRADIVVEQLVRSGLPQEKIRAKGYGFRFPASTSDARNRRAVIRLFSPPKDGDPFLAELIRLTTD